MPSGLSRQRAPFHSLSLTLWLLAAMLPSVLTSNPVLVAVALLLVVGWMVVEIRRQKRSA